MEGRRGFDVDDPATGKTIVDIDLVQGGTLWELKSAVNAVNPVTGADETAGFLQKQVAGKIDKYLRARQYLKGYENAPIGLRFTRSGVDPAFRAAVENEVARQRAAHPGVTIRLEWTP